MSCSKRAGKSARGIVGVEAIASCHCRTDQIESLTTARTCCECEGGVRRSIYLDHTSDSDDSCTEFHKHAFTRDIRLGTIDVGCCKKWYSPDMESSRKNNSTESPTSSYETVNPSLEPQWDLHDSMNPELGTKYAGMRSGAESCAPNNYHDDNVAVSQTKKPGRGYGYWNVPKSPQEQYLPSRDSLISSLEQTIAVLRAGFQRSIDIDEEFGSTDEENVAFHTLLSTPEMEFVSECSVTPPEDLVKMDHLSLEGFTNSHMDFPIPCTMASTYEDQMIFPMETMEEYCLNNADADCVHSEGRLSPIDCPVPESNRGAHSSRKSYNWRGKSIGRGATSVSTSDWDVYEAGIQIKRGHGFSDSDGAFEDFVREQEMHFTPPVVLAGDAWDPMENHTPFESLDEFDGREDVNHGADCKNLEIMQSLSLQIPSVHEIGVQVCSEDLEPRKKSGFLHRLLSRSSDAHAKLITTWKSKKATTWLTRKRSLQSAPAAVKDCSDMNQFPSLPVSLIRSVSPITVVSLEQKGCGWQSQLMKLVPWKLIQFTPRKHAAHQFVTGGFPEYSNEHDGMFYLENTSLAGDTLQTGHSVRHQTDTACVERRNSQDQR